MALEKVPGYRGTAVRALAAAPESVRPQLLHTLGKETAPSARWLESDLRARWGDPLGGYEILAANLPADRGRALEAVSGFLDQLRDQTSPEARRAQGLALAALAERTPGPGGWQLRLEAAQAFADGDEAAARRLLGGMAADSGTSNGIASGAATTLVGVLVKEGKVEEAEERKLEELKSSLVSEDWTALRRTVAWGWVRTGNLGRADSMLAGTGVSRGSRWRAGCGFSAATWTVRRRCSRRRVPMPAAGMRPRRGPRCSRCCNPSRPRVCRR